MVNVPWQRTFSIKTSKSLWNVFVWHARFPLWRTANGNKYGNAEICRGIRQKKQEFLWLKRFLHQGSEKSCVEHHLKEITFFFLTKNNFSLKFIARKMNFGQHFVPYRSAAKNMYLKGECSFWFYTVAQPITANVSHKVLNQNPDSSMLCEVKGKEDLKNIGNKTFFNLSYPFFLGHLQCSMSFCPFKSVGSTKGGGGTADIATSASYSVTSLLFLFMSLSEIV